MTTCNLEEALLEPPCCLPHLCLPASKTISQSYICAVYTLLRASSSQQPGCQLPAASAVLRTNPKSCCPRGDSGWLRCSDHHNPVASLENARSWTLPGRVFLSQFFLKENIIFKNRIWRCTRTRCVVFKGAVRWCQVEEHLSRRLASCNTEAFLLSGFANESAPEISPEQNHTGLLFLYCSFILLR